MTTTSLILVLLLLLAYLAIPSSNNLRTKPHGLSLTARAKRVEEARQLRQQIIEFLQHVPVLTQEQKQRLTNFRERMTQLRGDAYYDALIEQSKSTEWSAEQVRNELSGLLRTLERIPASRGAVEEAKLWAHVVLVLSDDSGFNTHINRLQYAGLLTLTPIDRECLGLLAVGEQPWFLMATRARDIQKDYVMGLLSE